MRQGSVTVGSGPTYTLEGLTREVKTGSGRSPIKVGLPLSSTNFQPVHYSTKVTLDSRRE